MKRLFRITEVNRFVVAFVLLCTTANVQAQVKYETEPPFNPPTYVSYYVPAPITVDGILSPDEWDRIPALSDFIDIMGAAGEKPHLQTIVKMAHDDNGVYIGAWMEEPHVWATITTHDAALYQENAFELFFDPSNDTHHYLEYQVNALGTIWDLYLSRPYRDNPVTFSDWEFMGMKSAVSIEGTINNPTDTDRGWSAEIFIPWRSLYQVAPRKRKPGEGDQMRVNFMRVQWPLEVKDGQYVKLPKPEGRRFAESYWLWSPIGKPSIHLPEYWGYVQFTDKKAGEEEVAFVWNPDEDIKWMLRQLHLRQLEYKKATGKYADQTEALRPLDICTPEQAACLRVYTTPSFYEIIYTPGEGVSWHIRFDGLVWSNQ